MTTLLASVAVPVPLYRSFDYRVPADSAADLRRGSRVRVPFGRRELVGIVVAPPRETAADGADFRPIGAVLDDTPLLPPDLLAVCEWAADYYHHPLGEVCATALPGRGSRPGWRRPAAGGATAAHGRDSPTPAPPCA